MFLISLRTSFIRIYTFALCIVFLCIKFSILLHPCYMPDAKHKRGKSKRDVREIFHSIAFPPIVTSSDLKSNVYTIVDSAFRVANLLYFYLNFIHKNRFYLIISTVVYCGVQFFHQIKAHKSFITILLKNQLNTTECAYFFEQTRLYIFYWNYATFGKMHIVGASHQ